MYWHEVSLPVLFQLFHSGHTADKDLFLALPTQNYI